MLSPGIHAASLPGSQRDIPQAFSPLSPSRFDQLFPVFSQPLRAVTFAQVKEFSDADSDVDELDVVSDRAKTAHVRGMHAPEQAKGRAATAGPYLATEGSARLPRNHFSNLHSPLNSPISPRSRPRSGIRLDVISLDSSPVLDIKPVACLPLEMSDLPKSAILPAIRTKGGDRKSHESQGENQALRSPPLDHSRQQASFAESFLPHNLSGLESDDLRGNATKDSSRSRQPFDLSVQNGSDPRSNASSRVFGNYGSDSIDAYEYRMGIPGLSSSITRSNNNIDSSSRPIDFQASDDYSLDSRLYYDSYEEGHLVAPNAKQSNDGRVTIVSRQQNGWIPARRDIVFDDSKVVEGALRDEQRHALASGSIRDSSRPSPSLDDQQARSDQSVNVCQSSTVTPVLFTFSGDFFEY